MKVKPPTQGLKLLAEHGSTIALEGELKDQVSDSMSFCGNLSLICAFGRAIKSEPSSRPEASRIPMLLGKLLRFFVSTLRIIWSRSCQ
jgi:hypothetical protein